MSNLDKELERIVKECNAASIDVFWGMLPEYAEEERVLIEWNTNVSDDWEEFLRIAVRNKATLLYLDIERYKGYEYANDGHENYIEIMRMLKKLKKNEGLIEFIRMVWVKDDIFHVFVLKPSWAEDLSYLDDLIDEMIADMQPDE